MGAYFDEEYTMTAIGDNKSLPVCLQTGEKFKGKFGDFSIETFEVSKFKSDASLGIYFVRTIRATINLPWTH